MHRHHRHRLDPAKVRRFENIELLVACTLNWAGIRAKGQPLPFSVDNARVIYAKLPWLREQVKAFIEDRANFLKASAPT